jgi:hypothetical protein
MAVRVEWSTGGIFRLQITLTRRLSPDGTTESDKLGLTIGVCEADVA